MTEPVLSRNHTELMLKSFGADVKFSDEYKIIPFSKEDLESAKLMALTAAQLLFDNAKGAKAVKDNFKPYFTKQQYLKYLEGEIN